MLNILLQALTGLSRCTDILFRKRDLFKMQGMKNRIRFAGICICHKIAAVHIVFIPHALQKYRFQVFIQVFFKSAVIIHIDPSEPYPHITVSHNIMQIYLQRPERLQHIQLLS